MRFPMLRVLAIALVTVFLGAPTATAQRGKATRVPVLVALVDSIPNTSTAFLIQRHARGARQDVILLRADATPDQLSEAIHALVLIRHQGGDTAAAGAAMRVRPGEGARRAVPRPLPWAPRVIADLRRAERQPVPGVGTVPVVEIWLPRQRGRRPSS